MYIPYSRKFWRALNLANWAKMGFKKIWRNFNLANSNELACAPRRAVVGSENERWSTCTYVCFVYTALGLSRVSSRAHSKVATLRTCEVEQTTEAKARMENGRDIQSGKLRSWTPCVQPRVEPHSWRAAIYCARGKLATRMTCMLWRLYAWGHEYTCVHVHVV